MNDALNQALTLLGVGMLSVFVVLTIVVLTGQTLIRITNRMVSSGRLKEPAPKAAPTPSANTILPEHLAVLAAVVDHVTAGAGRVSNIKPEGHS